MPAQDPNVYTGFGIAGLVAIELAAQVTSGTGNAPRLLGAGVPAVNANTTAALITGGAFDPATLVTATNL